MPVVTRVQLLNSEGKIISDKGDEAGKSNLLKKSFDIHFINFENSHNVGTLVLSSSRNIVFEKVRYAFAFILVNAVIKSIALWCIFLWFGKRLISTPLFSLTHSIEHLDLDNLHSTTIQTPIKNHNEISILTDSFNQMIKKLADSKSALDDRNNQLKQEITEHKETKLEIDSLNAELDERVKKRTLQLRNSQQDAEHANQAKTQFLSRMSHELRTPLNEILGFAQIQSRLLKKSNDDHLKDTTQHIIIAGNNLLRIVDDILSYAQMDQQHEDIPMEVCDIDFAVKESINQQKYSLTHISR